MKIIKEWTDFVTFPANPARIKHCHERLDLTGSTTDADELFQMGPEERKFRVTKEPIVFDDDDDAFEALGIGGHGSILIWTRTKIWFLQRFGGMEKLHYLPRHPPVDGELTRKL